jgi:hypothetical protein
MKEIKVETEKARSKRDNQSKREARARQEKQEEGYTPYVPSMRERSSFTFISAICLRVE